MITPSFGLTATERVLPNLALDFTTALLDSRITFTRTTGAGNPATYVNSSGYITAATNNQPRFDYDPVTLACKGLLIEESRSNLFTASENPTWSVASEVTVNNSATAGPDNTTSGQQIIASTNNTLHYVQSNTAYSATGNHVFSVFLKAGGYSFAQLNINFTGGNGRAVFNLGNGTVSSSVNSTATIEPAANGFYRCSIVVNVTNTGAPQQFIYLLSNASTATFAGNGTSGIYMYGRQLEAGAFATSYIPTTTTALTRNADVAVMTGTNFSSWFNASEGGAVIQVLPRTISGTRPAVEFDDNTANETIVLRGVAADPQLYVVDGGAAQATLDAGTITANAAYRLAGAWKSSSFATAINGAASVSQLSGTYPTVTQARFGSDGTNYLNGWLQNFRYWPQRITNAETQAFSK